MARYWHLFYIAVILVLLAVVGLWRWPGLAEAEPPGGPQESAGIDEAMQVTQADAIRRFQVALINKTRNYDDLTWLGNRIWQPPLDLWTLQETIFEVQPELIVECGTYQGGSSYFFGQLFDLMGKGRVITIDIKKLHDLSHPRVTYLIGDSASPRIVERVRKEVSRVKGPVMVILDSNHSQHHVSKELAAYHDFVTPGSFLHIQDGVIDQLPLFIGARPGPLRAVEEFLRTNDEFELDQQRCERFLITHHPKGWLRRKGAAAK